VDATAIAMRPGSDGVFKLSSGDADHMGDRLKMSDEVKGLQPAPTDDGYWNILVAKAGTYAVEIEYGCDDKSAGAKYGISVADQKVSGTVASTGAWKKTRTDKPGELKLNEGKQTVKIEVSEIKDRGAMSLREIRLKPM
jgi:hypothetical protein